MKSKSTNPVEYRPFACSRDGLTIRGTIFRPAAHPSVRKLPIVIISHGFGGCWKDVEPYARFIAGMGFAGIAFDFNGGGPRSTSDGATEDMTVYTESEDLKAVIRAAAEEPDLDAGDVTLMGCSQGGVVSAITASTMPDQVHRLILFFPALCIPDDARKGSMLQARFDPENIPAIIDCGAMKLGAAYPESVMRDDFRNYLKFSGPTLIVHGTDDPIVNVRYSEEAAEVLPDARLFLVTGAGHGFAPGPQDDAAMGAVSCFLDGYEEFTQVNVACDKPVRRGSGLKIHVSIPFIGTAKGDFSGMILAGASDEQEYQGTQNLSMCATYTIDGRDSAGVSGSIHVINRGTAGDWHPTVTADGGVLSGWDLTDCRAVLDFRPEGPMVHLYARKKSSAADH